MRQRHFMCAILFFLFFAERFLPAASADDASRRVPPLDANAKLILREPFVVPPQADATLPRYFRRPIARTVHEVVGMTDRASVNARPSPWPAYCRQHGFDYHAYRIGDPSLVWLNDIPHAQQTLQALVDAQRPEVAQKLLSLLVLHKLGGIAVGPEASPPHLNNVSVDLGQVLHMQGLSVVSALHARNVEATSIYITDALMAASAGHPWVTHVAQLAIKNCDALLAGEQHDLHARYYTGDAFLSRQLGGSFSVVPFTFLQRIGVFEYTRNPGDGHGDTSE